MKNGTAGNNLSLKLRSQAVLPDILTSMPIQKRFLILMTALVLALTGYGLTRHYAPSLVYFVVEQTLIEKAPPGTDAVQLRKRFYALISSAPDQKAKMDLLFRISGYLEKVQSLTPVQLDGVMGTILSNSGMRPVFLRNWNFFHSQDVLYYMDTCCGFENG
jgi:hypothetical protein